MAHRGQITDEIKAKAKELLGKEITQKELRLIPYVHFCITNDKAIDPAKVDAKERSILSEWRKAEWIEGGASGLGVTKDFFDFMSEMLWLGYVAYDEA